MNKTVVCVRVCVWRWWWWRRKKCWIDEPTQYRLVRYIVMGASGVAVTYKVGLFNQLVQNSLRVLASCPCTLWFQNLNIRNCLVGIMLWPVVLLFPHSIAPTHTHIAVDSAWNCHILWPSPRKLQIWPKLNISCFLLNTNWKCRAIRHAHAFLNASFHIDKLRHDVV
jgi:hypothetical protein